jgi:hypothetical protein
MPVRLHGGFNKDFDKSGAVDEALKVVAAEFALDSMFRWGSRGSDFIFRG